MTKNRSTNAQDYQDLPQNVVVMRKHFEDGHVVPTHHHPRNQLIFAVTGLMRIKTTDQTWVVPPDRAVYLPAGLEHQVEMRGNVEMRTLYISASTLSEPKVLSVNRLLNELIAALALTPMDYSGNRRAELIADLIEVELFMAKPQPLFYPMPTDRRLLQVCQQLLTNPATDASLDRLAFEAGASAKTISRICRKELGMSFSEWRRRIRFATALELLAQGYSIKQIAGQCGYASTSAFTYAFRNAFGAPPTAFQV